MNSPYESVLEQFEAALAELKDAHYELTLYVIGASDLSARAIANVRQICDRHLPGRYNLSVVDLFDDPEAVKDARVLAAPTLVKNKPLPVRRLVGDLSSTDRVLLALEIPLTASAPSPSG